MFTWIALEIIAYLDKQQAVRLCIQLLPPHGHYDLHVPRGHEVPVPAIIFKTIDCRVVDVTEIHVLVNIQKIHR